MAVVILAIAWDFVYIFDQEPKECWGGFNGTIGAIMTHRKMTGSRNTVRRVLEAVTNAFGLPTLWVSGFART